jgi:hypothetical protein
MGEKFEQVCIVPRLIGNRIIESESKFEMAESRLLENKNIQVF